MSLVNLFDELLDPQSSWNRGCVNHTNNSLSNLRGQLVANPQVDMYPVEGGMELKADLPGMAKEDVTLTVDGNTVTLSGERKQELERDEGKWHYAERRFGKFSRRFRLPFQADTSLVSAKFDNGVLTVSIPQPEATRASTITIE